MVKFGGSFENPIDHQVLAKTVLNYERFGFDSIWFEDHLVTFGVFERAQAHPSFCFSTTAT
jgi:hypothetical protein